MTAALVLAAASGCGDDGGAVETDVWDEWCQTFTVFDGLVGERTEEVCICAESQPSANAFEEACLDQYAQADVCIADGTPSIKGPCPGGGPPYGTTTGPPDNDCPDGIGPGGECCDSDVETDCCVGQACPNYDFANFPYQAPTQDPAPGSPFTASLFSSSLTLTFAEGENWEDSDSTSIQGHLDYALADCGQTWCPFFLNRLTATADTSLALDIRIDGVIKTKTISNLEYHLFYPVLGRHAPGSVPIGEFAPKGMVFRTEFDLSGPEFGAENGHYSLLTRNSNTVFTTNTPSSSTFTFSNLEFDLGAVTGIDVVADVSQTVTLTDEPPSASASVSHTCENPSKATVTFRSSSTDPDNDIQDEVWALDGAVFAQGSSASKVLHEGTYDWILYVFDQRRAFDIDEGQYTFSCP